jgi:hypothetical protein
MQLFESVNTRVQKEKAGLQEAAAQQQRTAQGRFFGTMFSMCILPSNFTVVSYVNALRYILT